VKAEEMKHLVDCRNLLVLMYRYWERFHLALRYVLVEMKDHQLLMLIQLHLPQLRFLRLLKS
jgi:hypothetical protein